MPTKIEWASETWNPVTGCTPVSEGCENCYAERLSRVFWKPWGYDPPPDHFKVRLHDHRLDRIPKPTGPLPVFVCSMGDLFHEAVPFHFIYAVWWRMGWRAQTSFAVLTKRPQRMLQFIEWLAGTQDVGSMKLPENIWLGVTAENQERAEERIPVLLQIPAAVRFVSVEPMLGPVRLDAMNWPNEHGELAPEPLNTLHLLRQVICGGESGPGARPMNPEWPRRLRDQCVAAGVPFLFKQWGAYNERGERVGKKAAGRLLDGRVWDELPEAAACGQ